MALAAALSSAGCYATGPAPRGDAMGRPMPPLASAEPVPREQPFDPRLVDPRFEQAIVDYWRDLRMLRWDANDHEIRRSFRLFAVAAERVPYSASVDLARAAARVRGGRAPRGPAVQQQRPWPAPGANDPLEGPLYDLARAFVELGRGPYREGTGVLGAAYAFEQAVRAMVAARARGGDRRLAFEALGRGEELLLTIRNAIGRAEVGLGSSAPPPVDFGM